MVASIKIPMTHNAPEAGVAAGIVAGIERLLSEHAIDPNDVSFIAHSTTQATNALLEGDVAQVGVLGLLNGLGPLARWQMRFRQLLAARIAIRTRACLRRRTTLTPWKKRSPRFAQEARRWWPHRRHSR